MPTATSSWFKGEMSLLSITLLIVQFVRGAVLISLLPIYGAGTLGLSPDIIGIAISAHYITDTVLKIAIGYLLDRFSPGLILKISLIIALAGVYALQFADVPWMFIGAAAFYGIGMSPIWIICLTKVSAQHRATQMGTLYTIWLIGLGGGPILCNIMLDYSAEWTYQLLLLLSLAAALLGLVMRPAASIKLQLVPFGEQLRALKNQLSAMRMLLPGMILQTMAASMLLPILPHYAVDKLGFSGAQYSFLLASGGLFAVAGLIPMGKLSDRFGGQKYFLVGGFLAFAIGLCLLASGLSFWYCLIIALGLGLSYAAILPSWNALLASYVPPKQEGVGWGLLSTFEGVGVMVGPIAGGVLALHGGETAVFWSSAAVFALIGLFYARWKGFGHLR